MTLRRTIAVASSLAALCLLAMPVVSAAQDCVGNKPKGGMWVTSAELYLSRARTNANPKDKQKLYQQAIDVLEQGFEKQPDNPKNYALAGRTYAELNRFADADFAFSKAEDMWSCYAASIDSLRHRAWIKTWNLGVRYSQQGEYDKAMQHYLDAWTVYDKLPQPMLQLGSIYADQSLAAETDEAREEAQAKAIEAYAKAQELLAAGGERLSDAQRQEFARAAAFNLAQLLAFEERFEEAAESYDVYLQQDPGNVDAMSNAAVVMVRAANRAADEAEELEDGPQKEALMAKSDSLRTAARGFYAELLAREDLEAEEYHNIGLGLARIEMNAEAAVAYRKALELEPYRIKSLEQLARMYFKGEQYDSLAAVAQLLVERYPLSMDNLALLANAYRELEQLQDALAALEQREALQAELTDLDLESEEGVYTVSGFIYNMKLEPDTELLVQFDFYDDAGEVVASESVTVVAPPQESQARFSVSTESSALISGFTYRPADSTPAQAGN
ncbi:MAG: hypothetical protein V3U13_11085 [Gemmatimonadota bacterium]